MRTSDKNFIITSKSGSAFVCLSGEASFWTRINTLIIENYQNDDEYLVVAYSY